MTENIIYTGNLGVWSQGFNIWKALHLLAFGDNHLALIKNEHDFRMAATAHRFNGSFG